MVIKITILPKPTQGAVLDVLEKIKQQIRVGARAGEFDFNHSYIATGQSESDSYHCEWATTNKGN